MIQPLPDSEIALSDALRDITAALLPDARNKGFTVFDADGERSPSLQDQHCQIAGFVLNGSVPHEVRVHFETAKNLYLYAWFVYRFYPVAEQQALASLEFALRERLAREINGAGARGLSVLLRRAHALGLIRNDAIKSRILWAQGLARERYRVTVLEKMIALNITEMIVDDKQVKPTDAELAYDWIEDFVRLLPKIRNVYAHGTGMLYPNVLRTFDIVSDLINQLYCSLPDHCESPNKS